MTLQRALGLFVPLVLICGGAATAQAKSKSKVGLSFGVHTGSSDDTSAADTLVAPRLDVQIGISKGFAAQAILPMTSFSRGAGADGDFRLGNPYFGGMWGFDLGIVALQIGAGASLPFARIPDGTDGVAAADALATAQGISGLGDFWLYAPDTMALVVPMKAQLNILMFDVRADLTLATLISTGDSSTRQSAAQLGVEALFDLWFLEVGARLQTVWIPTAEGDKEQFSVAPLVELDLGAVYARSMFLVNLDGPSGFSFANGDRKYWGWHVGAGVKF